ncbi:hypothetical protein B566_EDAN002606 [Ephemera danica]|nr:hypothetical protein B566_EDAN002606 [Ephemera danica]
MAAIVRLQRFLNVGNQLYRASRTSQITCGLSSKFGPPLDHGTDRLEFQAETRMLLDIVAKSLYSEKEVSQIHFSMVNMS